MKKWMLIAVLALASLVALPQGAAQAARMGVATPFLYRPYYGSAGIISRSVSLFDHDEPWYANDGKFVRYDGTTYSGSAVTNCQPHISCYDGHNGYDLNMVFEPVLSSAGGTVIRAGWFNAMNHLDGGGLWVAIDHGVNPGNGVDYVTMYCHLSAVLVSVGQKVGTQWQIGTSGSTGSATGPHLHFTAFQMPNWEPMDPFGWTGAGADPNPTPDYYLWVGDPASKSQAPCLGCDNGQSQSAPSAMPILIWPGFGLCARPSAKGRGLFPLPCECWSATRSMSSGPASRSFMSG